MTDLSHLHSLNSRLSNERERLLSAKTEGEREMRAVWVAGIEKEIAQEQAFLGLPAPQVQEKMSDDELLSQLEIK